MSLEPRCRFIRLMLPFLAGLCGTAVPGPAAPQSLPSANWQSPARLRQGLRGRQGTLVLETKGVRFRSTQGPTLYWPFVEIQTFDLLAPRRMVLEGYENRGSRRRSGEQRFRFDLASPVPPAVAAELAHQVGKPVRNGDPDPWAPSFASIAARHPRHSGHSGGSNGTLRFREDGIDYVAQAYGEARSWRWTDIETLANPDPYHLRVAGYRETFDFELKQPLGRDLFDRLWDRVYARDLNVLPATGGTQP